MKAIFGFAAVVMILAGVVPGYLDNKHESTDAGLESSSNSQNDEASAKAYRDSMGHFTFSARLNGRRVNVLVDTGATSVAINRTTARSAGVRFGNSGTMRVSTANGTVTADRAVIKEVRVGNIIVQNVQALVVSDKSLNGTLLGMSFLKKLKRFEISGRTLVMVR